jgi:hypothetical protein
MPEPARKAILDWKVEEAKAEGLAKQLKQGVKIDEATVLPEDVVILDAKVLETPPAETGYRYVQAIYEARSR